MSDSTEPKQVVIGLLGVPGCGKTHLLRKISQELDPKSFAFYEGFEVIDSIVERGLDAFKVMCENEKIQWRQKAIERIQDECMATGKTAIVTGYFFTSWEFASSQLEDDPTIADFISKYLSLYTHIVYLDIPAEFGLQFKDITQHLPTQVKMWQEAEKDHLRLQCWDRGILLAMYSARNDLATLIRDWSRDTEEDNLLVAEECLDKVIADVIGSRHLERVLVLDSDRTVLLGNHSATYHSGLNGNVMEFEERHEDLELSHTTLRQIALTYKEELDDVEFDAGCEKAAEAMSGELHPLFTLLRLVSQRKYIHAVVVTSGLSLIWEKTIDREGLSGSVAVIGGFRNSFVATEAVKAHLVKRLQETHELEVWAFGDGYQDLSMLMEADRAIVLKGEKTSRTDWMNDVLYERLWDGSLSMEKSFLSSDFFPRLNADFLPILNLMKPKFIKALLGHRKDSTVVHATNKPAAKPLQIRMGDASLAGPSLREAHRRCGHFLAIEYISKSFDIEPYSTPDMQNHETERGSLEGKNPLIIALMCSGKHIASGVNDVFPNADSLHAWNTKDVKIGHLRERSTVILVDSVIKCDEAIVDFAKHIRRLSPRIRIVAVAGDVQAQAVAGDCPIGELLENGKLTVVALRLSGNQPSGERGPETRKRPFSVVDQD